MQDEIKKEEGSLETGEHTFAVIDQALGVTPTKIPKTRAGYTKKAQVRKKKPAKKYGQTKRRR